MKSNNEERDETYFLGIDVQYLDKLHVLHNDLPFLPKRMTTEKFEKLVANFYDKNECIIQTKSLKQALNHQLILKKVH